MRQEGLSEWIDCTYFAIRSLAKDYWKKRTGSDRVRTAIWERYHATFRHPVVQALKTVEELGEGADPPTGSASGTKAW